MPTFQKTRVEQISFGNTKQRYTSILLIKWNSTTCNTAALQHSSTATPQHCNNATMQHRNTATPQHCNTAALQHRSTATPQHCNTAALQHCSTAILQYCNTAAPLSDQSFSAQLFFFSSKITGGLYSFQPIELRPLSDQSCS